MKKLIALCACLLLVFTVGESAHLLIKRSARVSGAAVTLETSAEFSERDLMRAVKALKRRFLKEDTGVLESVTFSAEENAERERALDAQYGEGQAVILRADFTTDPAAGFALRGLEPATEYRTEWVLVRSAAGRWHVAGWAPR